MPQCISHAFNSFTEGTATAVSCIVILQPRGFNMSATSGQPLHQWRYIREERAEQRRESRDIYIVLIAPVRRRIFLRQLRFISSSQLSPIFAGFLRFSFSRFSPLRVFAAAFIESIRGLRSSMHFDYIFSSQVANEATGWLPYS